MWKRAAGKKFTPSRDNSITSDGSQNTKNLIFDVAEAEALMNEFGIAAPLPPLSIQVIILHGFEGQFTQDTKLPYQCLLLYNLYEYQT